MQDNVKYADPASSCEIKSLIPGGADQWTERRASCFLDEVDGKNPFRMLLESLEDILLVNGFDPSTHDVILDKFPGTKDRYDKAVLDYRTSHKREPDELDRWRMLKEMITRVRDRDLVNEESTHKVHPIGNQIEGGHRGVTTQMCLYESKYDPSKGALEVGSLDVKWLVKHLGSNPRLNRTEVEDKLKDIDIKRLLRTAMTDPASGFQQPVRLIVNYGVTKDRFKESGLTMENVKKLWKDRSEEYANLKASTSMPSVTAMISSGLASLTDDMESNEKNLNAGESPGWSANFSEEGELYVKHEEPKRGRGHGEDDQNLPCEIYDETKNEHWKQYLLDPSPENLRRYHATIKVGVASITKKDRKGNGNTSFTATPTGKVVCPPFRPTDQRMFHGEGLRFNCSDARRTAWDNGNDVKLAKKKKEGKITVVEEWYKMGEEHKPNTWEDHTMAVVIPLIHRFVFQADFGIPADGFKQHPLFNRYVAESSMMVRFVKTESFMETFGRPVSKPLWNSEPWYEPISGSQGCNFVKPENRRLPATVLIAKLYLASLNLGFGVTRDFLHMLASTPHDMDDYSDKRLVDLFGECPEWLFLQLVF